MTDWTSGVLPGRIGLAEAPEVTSFSGHARFVLPAASLILPQRTEEDRLKPELQTGDVSNLTTFITACDKWVREVSKPASARPAS